MSQFLPKIALLLNPIILAIVLAYTYTWARRYLTTPVFRNAVMGGIMAIAAMLAMLGPLTLADGIIVDLRNLIVGLAGAFFGAVALVIALAAAVWMRIHLGGAGAEIGVYAVTLSGIMGLLWAKLAQPKIQNQYIGLSLLAVMISAHLVVAFWLPQPVQNNFFMTIAPWLIAFNFLGAVLIGLLIQYEERTLQNQEMILTAANTDPLTKLLNRRSLIHRYYALSDSQLGHRGMAMLCFDIDHFKGINDTHGHLFGDDVLLEITRRIAGCLRPTDLFSRTGGDEFVIVLPDVNETEAALVADRCRSVIAERPITAEGHTRDVTISIGANWTAERLAFNALLSTTDQALYNAKALGRDCVAFNVRGVAGRDGSTDIARALAA